MSAISIKQLLEAGVHFGHQTHRWNPKMKDYIFGERNGIYIIDLQKTLSLFKEAVAFTAQLAAEGKTILFVGTKPQAQEAVEEAAARCGMFFVNNRWLGGLLTNFTTIQIGIKRYKELENKKANGFYERLSKKEVARLERERKKLEKNLRGIRDMDRLPDAVFVVDSNKESIAVKEAARLQIPVIAIVDTNCDPDVVDYVIPGNDDALRSVRLFASTIADAMAAGREVYTAKLEAQRKEAEEKAAREAAARKAAKEAKEAARKAKKEEEERRAAEKAAAEKAAAAQEKAPPPQAAEEKEEKKEEKAKPKEAAASKASEAQPEEKGKAAEPEKAPPKPRKAKPKAAKASEAEASEKEEASAPAKDEAEETEQAEPAKTS